MSAVLLVSVLLAQSPAVERVWLDSTSGDLTTAQWLEVENLLRAGLKRRQLEVTRDREPPATLVVQIRRIQNEYFVFAASGPAVAGSGVAMSRRVALSSITEGTSSLVLAQTAEELINAALAPAVPEPKPAPPAPSEPPAPPPPPPLTWHLSVEALADVDVFQGGAITVTGGAQVAAHLERWGLALSGGAGGLLPRRSSTGLVSGATAWLAVGPHVELLRLDTFHLDAMATVRAQWLSAAGNAPVEGFLTSRGEGWGVIVFAGVAPTLELTDRFFARLGVWVGWVVRGVAFVAEDVRLLALSGLSGSASLSVGARW